MKHKFTYNLYPNQWNVDDIRHFYAIRMNTLKNVHVCEWDFELWEQHHKIVYILFVYDTFFKMYRFQSIFYTSKIKSNRYHGVSVHPSLKSMFRMYKRVRPGPSDFYFCQKITLIHISVSSRLGVSLMYAPNSSFVYIFVPFNNFVTLLFCIGCTTFGWVPLFWKCIPNK